MYNHFGMCATVVMVKLVCAQVMSGHVETVVLLSKVEKSTKKIHVDFSLEDIDLSGLKEGATYEEIKDYVKDNFGFHVSSLNIAQTKEKYRIKERENYNFSKKQNAQVRIDQIREIEETQQLKAAEE